MVWPSPEPVTLTVFDGGTLELPVRAPSDEDASLVVRTPGQAGPPAAVTQLQPPRWERTVEVDEPGGLTSITNLADGGRTRLDAIGMTLGSRAEDRYTIREGDPLSARCRSRRTVRMERPGWRIRLEVDLGVSSTALAYHLTAQLDAFENDDPVFHRVWDTEVPRDGA